MGGLLELAARATREVQGRAEAVAPEVPRVSGVARERVAPRGPVAAPAARLPRVSSPTSTLQPVALSVTPAWQASAALCSIRMEAPARPISAAYVQVAI